MWPQDTKANGCSLLLRMAEVFCCAGHSANTAEENGFWLEGSTPLVQVHDMIPGCNLQGKKGRFLDLPVFGENKKFCYETTILVRFVVGNNDTQKGSALWVKTASAISRSAASQLFHVWDPMLTLTYGALLLHGPQKLSLLSSWDAAPEGCARTPPAPDVKALE